jgi:hypothetical protein
MTKHEEAAGLLRGRAGDGRGQHGPRWRARPAYHAEVRFGLLGPLEIRSPVGTFTISRPRHRAFFAYLLLHAGTVVPQERLIDFRTDASCAAPTLSRSTRTR